MLLANRNYQGQEIFICDEITENGLA